MKEMGEARYIPGMKIVRNCSKKLLVARYEAYIKRVLECFQIHYSKSIDTPVEKGLTLSLDECLKRDDENKK